MCPQSMSRVARRLGLSRQKARLVHPQTDAIFLRKSSDLLAKECQKVSRKPIHLGLRA
jgi:hypothetical protein